MKGRYYVIGIVLAVLTYVSFYFMRNNLEIFGVHIVTNVPVRVCTLVHYLGLYASIVILALCFARKEDDKRIKYLLCIMPAIFFSSLILLYTFNYFFDEGIDTNKLVFTFICAVTGTFLIYSYRKIFEND